MYDKLDQLDQHQSDVALFFWQSNLLQQEATLWTPVCLPIANPPPYAERVASQPAVRYEPVQQKFPLPQNENAVTMTILRPVIQALVADLFLHTGLEVTSSIIDEAPAAGPGTSAIGLRRPEDVDEEQWLNVQKFLIQVKLLSPEDWYNLSQCLQDGDEGFELTCDGLEIKSDLDALVPVWIPVLAQVLEQFHVSRAKYVVVTDYERYALCTLENMTTVSVSRIFYRDGNDVPAADLNIDSLHAEHEAVVMEVILASIFKATNCPDPTALWADMAVVRRAFHGKRRLDDHGPGGDDDELHDPPLHKKSSKRGEEPSTSRGPALTSLSLSRTTQLFADGDEPNYSTSGLHGTLCGTLELPSTEPELVNSLIAASQEGVLPNSSFGSEYQQNRPSGSDLSSGSASIEIVLGEFIGRGHTWDAFAATMAARLPGGEVFRAPVVMKHVDLSALEDTAQALIGYPELDRVLQSVDREAGLLRYLDKRSPGVAPRPVALWTVAGDHVLLATEDCGDALAADPRTLDEPTKRAVVDAYRKVHAAGVVHGDVRPRHVVRDRRGSVRLVDWEGAREVDVDSESGRTAVEREMSDVLDMLGLNGH